VGGVEMKHVVLYHRHTIVDTRPGCLHGALALAFVALVLMAGYVTNLLGIDAYTCNVIMLVSVVYALGYVVFVEAKNWIDRQLARGAYGTV
jgi:hypothetical protein